MGESSVPPAPPAERPAFPPHYFDSTENGWAWAVALSPLAWFLLIVPLVPTGTPTLVAGLAVCILSAVAAGRDAEQFDAHGWAAWGFLLPVVYLILRARRTHSPLFPLVWLGSTLLAYVLVALG